MKSQDVTIYVTGIRNQKADSAYNLRVSLTVADSATNHFYYAYVLLFVCGFFKLFRISQTLTRIP